MQTISFSCLVYDDGRSGISEYIHSVLMCLLKTHKVKVHILARDVETLKNNLGSDLKNLELITYGKLLENPVINLLYHTFVLSSKMKKGRPDMIYLPAANRRLMMLYPVPTVGIIHDLAEIILPQKFGLLRWFRVKFMMRLFINRLHRIIAVSQSTAADISKFYGIPKEKISVIYNGIKKFPESRGKYKPAGDSKYILYVSRIEHPGKNHIRLIKAFENTAQLDNSHHLVLAGNFKERHEEVLAAISKSPLQQRIHLTGFVTDEELADLYKNADLYICPSLYEGFGLTVVEAMSFNLPVLSSDKGSLPEVCADAAHYFDPYNLEEITSALKKYLNNDQLCSELRKKGKERVNEFDWDKHVSQVLKNKSSNDK